MQYQKSIVGTFATIVFVESADAADLEEKINAAFTAYAASVDPLQPNLYSLDLAGAGDGHTFVARLGFCSGTPVGAIGTPIVRCYQGSNAQALTAQRPVSTIAKIVDEPVAGASKGTKFMGAIVYGNPNT